MASPVSIWARSFSTSPFGKAGCVNASARRPKGRGLSYFYLEQYERAVQEYNKALELDPQYSVIYKYRGETYEALGKVAEAEADFKKYEELTGQKP